jgi:uncharacterized protein DUF3352
MPRIFLTLTAVTTAIVVAAGCGDDGASSSGAASLAPAGSLVYGEATLRPEGDQKAAIEELVEKFPGEGSAGDRIRRLMDKAFAESDSGLSYEDDVEPWLGDEAAFFVAGLSADGGDPAAALLVATDDEGATEDAIEKAAQGDARQESHQGRDYYAFPEDDTAAGVLDGWLVLGNEGGFEAAVDTLEGGEPIDEDDDYRETLVDAPDERLGFLYFNSPAVIELLERSPAGATLGQFRRFFQQPLVATLDADEAGVRFEASVPASLAAGFPMVAEGADLAGELPADSWLAMAQPDLGKTIDQLVELFGAGFGGRDVVEQQLRRSTGLDLQRDVISWMGDFGLFVRGRSVSELDGALMIETSDPAASKRAIDAVARLARESADPGEEVGPLELGGGGEGVTLRTPDLPEPIHLFQRDGKVVLAYGDAAARDALEPAVRLGDSAAFAEAEDALGGDYAISFYLAVEPILALADSEGAGADEDWRRVRPYLEPLGALVGGARRDGDKLRSAFGLTVK